MVTLSSLWLPILLSAVIVFVASSIIHMVLPLHRKDWQKLPAQDAVMDALRGFDLPTGDYMMPCPDSPAQMSSPEFLEKMNKGPVAILTVMRKGPPAMGGSLALWFLYSVLVSLFAGYVASRAAGGGAYLEVFRHVGTVAFVAYGLGGWPQSIWYKRSWATTLRFTIDGFVYALLTAGTFGWLWPR